jgi:restriction system protein
VKRYFKVVAGSKNRSHNKCVKEGFIGVGYGIDFDLTNELTDDWRPFNKKIMPYYLEKHPDKSRIAAGLACGMTWSLSKKVNIGDIIIVHSGKGYYSVGEITSDYYYENDTSLPHRRKVTWMGVTIDRNNMSDALKASTVSGTITDITQYKDEIESFIHSEIKPKIIATDDEIEDPSVFALEKHLEDFLVANWSQTELGKEYDLFEEDGELIGQQFPTETGPIDILAVSKDKKSILVIELKKGRASDSVVGQIQRYMGYVLEELAEESQTVKGIIIALEDDLRLKHALKVTRNIEFYKYEISFRLVKS